MSTVTRPRTAETSLDPVTLEVIRNALPAISDEMSVDLQRTSYNMMIYEVRDYCTALLGTVNPEMGKRYLVVASGGSVAPCSASGEWSQQLQDHFEAAFGR